MKKQVFTILLLGLCFLPIGAQTTSTKSDASAIYEKSSPAVVLVLCESADGRIQGSGVILRSDGIIATNFHVCDGATAGRIRLSNGDIYDEVSIVGSDEGKDIVILKINGTNLPILTLANSDQVKIGSSVYAIGSPRGLEGSITSGIVSAIRPASEIDPKASGFKFIQFTAPISPGSSGGPLLDDSGRVIGLTTGTRRDAQGINAAIPANYIAPLANSQAPGQTLAKLSATEPTRKPPERVSETGEDVMTNDGVISLVRIGLSPGLIIAKIKSSPSQFDTSTQALLKLTEAKVPDDVVIAMMDAQKQTRIAESQTKKVLSSFREQGSLSDLKGKTKVYIITNIQRGWITEHMRKSGFTVVDKIEDAEFFIAYREDRESGGGWTGDQEQKVGYLEVTAPPKDETSDRIRNIYSVRKTKYLMTEEQPHKNTIKQFLKDLARVK